VRRLEVIAQGDGSSPIRVEAGQRLLVRVQYRSGVAAYSQGSLSIAGDEWAPINVPLSLFLTDVRTSAPDTLVSAQGNTAQLAVQVHSNVGPPTHVHYRQSVTQLHTGLSMTEADVWGLNAGETRSVSLQFQADRDAPIGGNDVAIDQITSFPLGFFVRVEIVRPQLVVNPAQDTHLRLLGRRMTLQMKVSVRLSNGPPADVRFDLVSAPPGIAMDSRSFGIDRDQVITLTAWVDDPAPDDCSYVLAWTAINGTQSGQMNWQLHVARPVTIAGTIESGGLAALGGWYEISLNPDGTTRWRGSAHDSGADGYDYALSAVVRAPGSGRRLAFVHRGHVGGTVTSGDRDDSWDETSAPSAVLRDAFDDFARVQRADDHLDYTSDIGEAVGGVLSWLTKFAVGTVAGPVVGAVVFIGVEAATYCMTGSLVMGARIVENVLWLAGPENTLFAIGAELIANAGTQIRELTQEEYDWANGMADGQAQTFAGCLPPREKLLVTDIFGLPNRAFTFPRYDGKIVLNLGPSGYVDPRYVNQSDVRGEVFVHELVHACQIAHVWGPTMGAKAVDDAIVGDDAYRYGDPTDEWTSLDPEQQAQIVQDWFGGHTGHWAGERQTGIPRDTASPYYHYITDFLRIGVFV
jgi:hypothetical protein